MLSEIGIMSLSEIRKLFRLQYDQAECPGRWRHFSKGQHLRSLIDRCAS
jgi:hypothetical protein